MRYNHHFENQFGSCRLLLEGFDPHRNRKVQLRMLPGEFDVVGITDGVDSWVTGVNAESELVAKARRVLEQIRAGKDPRPMGVETRVRRPLQSPVSPQEEAPRQRHRLVVDADAPSATTPVRIRRVLSS